MRAVILKASDDNYSKIKYFRDLNDLLNFLEENNCGLILEKNWCMFDQEMKTKCKYTITIYDDYIE